MSKCVSLFALCLLVTAPLFAQCDHCGMGSRIIDGTNVPSSQFPTVGQIGDASGGFYCTGTLIAPRFVLCAAHCVVEGSTGLPSFSQTNGRFKLGGVTYHSVHVYTNSSYHGDVSQEAEGALDLSIFELEQDVPNVTPSPLYRQIPAVGTLLTLVGYGELGTGAKGATNTLPREGTVDFGHTPIDVVTETFIKWNFDNVPPPNQESNTAPGDSGGPQFITVNNALQVSSVTSGGKKNNAGFGDVSYNTRIDIAAAWIDSITGGDPVAGNHPPEILSVSFGPDPLAVGQEAAFTTAASDPDGDTLHFHWFFGDGTEDAAGAASETHTYTADGTYAARLIVTDGNGGSVEKDLSVKVGTGINLLPSLVTSKKFTLNFKAPARGSLDFTLLNLDFFFPDKFSYLNQFDGATANVLVGTTPIDSLTLKGTRGKNSGSLTFNFRKGTLRYQVRNNTQLVALLAAFGAVNQSVSVRVRVPLEIDIGLARYGGAGNFDYTGKQEHSGTGK